LAELSKSPAELPAPRGPFRRLLEMPNDSLAKTLFVSVSVCLVCSLVVSSTAVTLAPRKAANRERERQLQMAAVLASVPEIASLVEAAGANALEAKVVDLRTGTYVDDISAGEFDQRKAAKDPEQSVALSADSDIAGLGRRSKNGEVYLLRDERGRIRLIILPVSGTGFASTIYGYLALAGDLNTIRGITFYEHEETPGLGAEIENTEWRAKWNGKKVRDETGGIRVRVADGKVEPGSAAAAYEVDAISGATWTSDGVSRLVRFWLGDDGFGPYLERLAAKEGIDGQ
jgi:Na+-transporting NADH:ubiquinone oxidoreductase subunit C